MGRQKPQLPHNYRATSMPRAESCLVIVGLAQHPLPRLRRVLSPPLKVQDKHGNVYARLFHLGINLRYESELGRGQALATLHHTIL